jgi:hypothetical protein
LSVVRRAAAFTFEAALIKTITTASCFEKFTVSTVNSGITFSKSAHTFLFATPLPAESAELPGHAGTLPGESGTCFRRAGDTFRRAGLAPAHAGTTFRLAGLGFRRSGPVPAQSGIAFRGTGKAFRDAFQVGVNKPGDLAAVLARARTILTSCGSQAYAGQLAGKAWTAADTKKLSDAIAALDAVDNAQETAKAGIRGATDARNAKANQLFDALQTIQNAANLQWPDSGAGNRATRVEFRIGFFPPSGKKGKQPATPPTPVPAQAN